MPGTHSKLAPSAAHRWMACPGSLVLEGPLTEGGAPEPMSPFAAEGTAAHELAAMCLTEKKDAQAYHGRVIEVKDEETGDTFKFTVDDEMIYYVQEYVDRIHEYANAGNEGCDLMVEQTVDFSRHVGVPDQTGTSDVIILVDNEIQIHDLKYGRGVKVEAERNKQLLLYALGAYDQFGMLDDFFRVRLVIHQPRINGHLSEWDITIDELLAFSVDALQAAQRAEQAQVADDIAEFLVPGDDQCRWCKAKAHCPALARSVTEDLLGSFDDLTADNDTFINSTVEQLAEGRPELDVGLLNNSHIADLLPKLDLIRGWCDAIHARAYYEAEAGRMPKWKLVAGRRGNRAWADKAEAEKTMKSMRVKKDDMYTLNLISPAQAEKKFKANPKRWQRLETLITQPDGKPCLVPESDPRPALPTATDSFDVIEDNAETVTADVADLV